MSSSVLRASVAQINVELLELDANLAKHADYIQQARQQGSELLLFPELSLTGYQLGRDTPRAAMRDDDERLHQLAALAPELCVLVGFVEQASPGEYYNAMAVLQHGRVLAVHRKLNPPTYGGLEEGKWYSRGQRLTRSEIRRHWSASTLICADLWNPALVHCALLQRPELLLAPINSASAIVSDEFSNEQNWLTNVGFYAMTYGTPLLMANRYGAEKDAWFWGGSRILGPRGETLAEAGDGEMLISAELTLDDIAAARFDLPTIRDADTPLIRRLLDEL
ncbi:nitrilase-related carbon-nitrogen hydrolase [Marinobacterium arenosum]|uniref:nitrilase-related carbon-nitrogen hydrolase n=1 Tax=Marinobacterium arenosum TaxID=2862496 RepID=UPI001C95F614|nr:nitrilase-related carbon-nitrogen hydrolase [Marinobacterium arenosum]MBY4677539.1 NAD+ synthetase [Marinobacterium arenosum]